MIPNFLRAPRRALATGIFSICTFSAVAHAAGPLVFHEVYPDDGVSYQAREYLTIVNRSETPLSLEGWALTTKASAQSSGSLVQLPHMVHLRPGQQFLIAADETALLEASPELRVDAHVYAGTGGSHPLTSGIHAIWGSGGALNLPPAEQQLQLVAPDGTISDAIAWGNAPSIGGEKLPSRTNKALAWRRVHLAEGSGALGVWALGAQQAGSAPQWACAQGICGNGFLEPGETCDDGNTGNGDGCSSACRVEEGAFCVHSELPCGGSAPRPTHCYFPAEVCEQPIQLSAVYIPTDEGVGHWCQDWIEFRNAGTKPFPLHALRLTEDIDAALGVFAGWDAFAPNQWLGTNERALVLARLTALERQQDRQPGETCYTGTHTGFSYYFGTPPGQWFARWALGPHDKSARWDDFVGRRGIQLNGEREQISAFCEHNGQNFDVFAFAKNGIANGSLPKGWSGDRARWYPELLQYNIMQHVVFRRYPESQDSNTKADWHLSRCPDPGLGNTGREAPIQGAPITRALPADGSTVRVTLSDEARQRADGQIWVVPPHDPRIEVLASEGSVLFRNITTPEIFEFEWFALTPCWVSEKQSARIQFGDAVRCFPDADADGWGDANAAGVVVGGSCAPGFVENKKDCNDTNGAIHPGALELCDNIDNDCDTNTLDGENEVWFEQACDGTDADLCEDGRMICIFASAHCLETGPTKLDYCDGVDNDCNSATADGADDPRVQIACDGGDPDLCLDGLTQCFQGAVVCNELTPADRTELCDGRNNDCNVGTPDGYNEPLFGQRCQVGVGACAQSATYICQNSSMICPAIPHPSAADDKTCDGIDDDCNGHIDDGVDETPLRCGVGACEAIGVERCDNGRFISECVPGAPIAESYESGNCSDGFDNDCDGLADDRDPDCQPLRHCYYDADGDGFPGTAVQLRVPYCDGTWEGHELSEINFDCNDDPSDACALRARNGHRERCDGCDNDCNGLTDETFPTLGKACDTSVDHCSDRRWECNDLGDALICGKNTVDSSQLEPERTCDDSVDNDCDGFIDGDDPDCQPNYIYSGAGGWGCSTSNAPGLWTAALLGLIFVAGRRRRERCTT